MCMFDWCALDSEEDAPKAKKVKSNSSQCSISKTPTQKNTAPLPTAKKNVITPTSSKKGGTTPTSVRRLSAQSSKQPTVTLRNFFGDKPIKRVTRPRPHPPPVVGESKVETVPESPTDEAETLAMFDEMVKGVSENYSSQNKVRQGQP